jgi:hypothetical protein
MGNKTNDSVLKKGGGKGDYSRGENEIYGINIS